MKHEYKVGDKVTLDHGDFGVCTLTESRDDRNGSWWWGNADGEKRWTIESCFTPYRVPVGYVGKLKDMDLQRGDVVQYPCVAEYAYEGPRMMLVPEAYTGDSSFEGGKYENLDRWTLVSRGNNQPGEWSDWMQSKKDGTFFKQDNREYETQELPDTDQVMYRWRYVYPIEEWVDADVNCGLHSSSQFQVKKIAGVPQWHTIKYVPF